MTVPPFCMAKITVPPGTRASIDLPAGYLYTHTPLSIPVHVVHGRKQGPCLVVSAAVHGDEINGVEIIRRMLRLPALRRLSGTLVAVPVVNVLGFVGRSRYLPDRRDLNRCFPGNDRGSVAARLAWLFRTEVLSRASHVVDLHTAAIHRDNLPQIRADLDDAGAEALARAFGVPVVIHSPIPDGSLRSAARNLEVPAVTFEGGEALRFDESAIRAGLRGLQRVMRHLGMLAASRSGRKPAESQYIADSSSWVRASQDGILRAVVALGDRVRRGQPLGWISDPFGDREAVVAANAPGLVIGRTNLPLVHQGEALFHIARFDQVGRVYRDMARYSEALENEEDWPEPPIV